MDQTSDLNGQELHRINSVYPLPDFVKEASQLELCGDETVEPHQFADVSRRLYPCHNKAATVLSAVFFHEKRAEMTAGLATLVEGRLNAAADYFGVRGDVTELMAKVAEGQQYDETALPDSDFAVVFDATDGTKERHYPMRNAGEVKAAADWLVQERDELPYDDRNKIATRVLQKGSVYGTDLSQHRDMLEKMAGLGMCSGKSAAVMIRTRISAIGNTHQPSELQLELEKLAQLCEGSPERIHHYVSLTKIASVVDQFDREYGLNRRYDDVIQRPEELFAITEKLAVELSHDLVGSPLSGNYYKKADLEHLPVSELADALGDDFTSAVAPTGGWVDTEKLANIVPTLPRGDIELFDEVASASGIMPFATKAASVGRSIPVADQVAFSAKHTPRPGSLWDGVPG
jgi:hypothetical protein